MIYVEYGLDFDNNRFGFGRSVEVEQDDGTEYRTKQKVKLTQRRYYFRFWVGKFVFVISGDNGFEIVRKKRYNFKIVLGVEGKLKRQAARAILITKKGKLLLMKRTKLDGIYYVTIGGGIEAGETSEQALLRELKEESGSIINKPVFAFHYDDLKRQTGVDFFICKEVNRRIPTGSEWTKWNTPENQYELVEVSAEMAKALPLKPEAIKDKIIDVFIQNSV